MPSNKDTKKKLPEILDKFASNSEKVTKQLGEMSSQLSAFVDMLSENVRKQSRRQDIEDDRREKARLARDQKESDKAFNEFSNKFLKDQRDLVKAAENELIKYNKDVDKAAKDADKAANKAAKDADKAAKKAAKELAQINKAAANKAAKDQKESDKAAKIPANKAAKDADKAAKELQQARNEYAEAVKGLAQLDKDEIQNARQKEIAGLKEKGTPYSDIADKHFESGDILGGLFASIFARKESPDKKRLADLQKQEKDYTEQEEARTKEDTRTQAKKKLQESVTKLQGSEKPAAASLSPSKITNPEDQIVAETIKLNDEDKLEQSQEQTKRLGTLDENISRIWTDHLQVSIVDISDPAIDKFKGIFSGLEASQNKSGGILSEILGFSKFLPEIMPALTTLGTTYLVPLLIPLAAIAIAAAVWKGLAWLLNKDAEEAQDRGLKEQAAKLAAAKSATNKESAVASNTVKEQAAQAITIYGDVANTPEYAAARAKEAEENGNKTLAAAWYEEGRSRLAKQTTAGAPTATTTDDQTVVDVPAPTATTTDDQLVVDVPAPAATPAAATPVAATPAPTPAATPAPTPAATPAPTPAAARPAPTPAATPAPKPAAAKPTAPKPAAAKPTAKPKPAAAPTPTPKSSSEEISKILKLGPGFNTVEMSDGTVQTRKGDRNWRNNNPGNIRYGDFAKSKGAIGTDGSFAIFPTYVMGRKAKSDLLFEGKNYKDLNIKQAISRYAPPVENDTSAYIKAVTSAVGGTENTNLRDLTSDQRVQFLTAVQKQEGFRQGTIIPESPSIVTSTPKTGVNVVAAMKNKAETEGGNPVTIAPITTNNVISGAKSGDELPYRDPRDYIRKAFNMDIFGSVTRSSAG